MPYKANVPNNWGEVCSVGKDKGYNYASISCENSKHRVLAASLVIDTRLEGLVAQTSPAWERKLAPNLAKTGF